MSSPTPSEPTPVPAAEPAEAVIRLEHASVRYRLPSDRIPSIKDYGIRWMKGDITFNDHWALRDVSLEVRRGETLGIVGPNGAGKSTLLKLVARVLRPTSGRVWVKGLVAPLLELGAGFDHELTGRENVFLSGTTLGYRLTDLVQRFDRIVDFAGIRDFIDLPLRTYSTGMVARLGFAVATDAQPAILLLDEILAVGDAGFQKKSAERLQRLKRHGDAVIMVSHSLASIVPYCDRVAWLDRGQVRAIGPAAEIVERYRRDCER
jgi:ABC-2 type transport system ATP-binding protein